MRTTAVTKHSVDNRSLIASATAASLSSSVPEGGSVGRNQRGRDEARARTFKHQHETRAVDAHEVWMLAKALFQFENRAVAGGLHDDNARSVPATAPHPNAPDIVAFRNSAPFHRRLFIRHRQRCFQNSIATSFVPNADGDFRFLDKWRAAPAPQGCPCQPAAAAAAAAAASSASTAF